MADSKDIKRLKYFTGQFLEAQDFQDEQSYHIGMRRRLNQLLYSPGIVDDGFAVAKAGEKRIEVAAGFAIDADGRELIFTTPQQKDVSGFDANSTVFVALRYADNTLPEDNRAAENITGFIRITEQPEILLQTKQPTGKDKDIALLIAKLQLDAGGNIQAVDTSVRQLANLHFNGNRQITFADNPASNNLKVQLRSGCGLGINDSTLYYAAGGKHSWRDKDGVNERMALSVAADGGLTVLGTGNSSFAGNVGIGTASPANRLHIDKGRVDITTSDATGGGQNRFNGVRVWNEAPARRGQLVVSSSYSDVVIASSEGNDAHGSTLTFAAYNPNNAAEYRKWVINQGNWGARKHFLEFGYSDAARSNPHENINSTDTVLTLDGINKRVGIGATSPGTKLTVSAPNQHLQLRREIATTGGKQIFLELFQDDNDIPSVPAIAPCIQLSHKNRFTNRIEAKDTGFHFKGGALEKDDYLNITAFDVHMRGGNLKAVGAKDTLRIVCGTVDADGEVKFASGTFTAIGASVVGVWDIVFNPPFSAIPAVTVTQIFNGMNQNTLMGFDTNFNIGFMGGDPRDNAVITYLDKNRVRIKTGGGDGRDYWRCYSFIAIGLP